MDTGGKGTAALTAFIEWARPRFRWKLLAREVRTKGGAISILGREVKEGCDAAFLGDDGDLHIVEVASRPDRRSRQRRMDAIRRRLHPAWRYRVRYYVATYVSGWNPQGTKPAQWMVDQWGAGKWAPIRSR